MFLSKQNLDDTWNLWKLSVCGLFKYWGNAQKLFKTIISIIPYSFMFEKFDLFLLKEVLISIFSLWYLIPVKKLIIIDLYIAAALLIPVTKPKL